MMKCSRATRRRRREKVAVSQACLERRLEWVELMRKLGTLTPKPSYSVWVRIGVRIEDEEICRPAHGTTIPRIFLIRRRLLCFFHLAAPCLLFFRCLGGDVPLSVGDWILRARFNVRFLGLFLCLGS